MLDPSDPINLRVQLPLLLNSRLTQKPRQRRRLPQRLRPVGVKAVFLPQLLDVGGSVNPASPDLTSSIFFNIIMRESSSR